MGDKLMLAARAGFGGLSQVLRPSRSSLLDNQVLIKVQGIGINRPDLLQDAGVYPARPGMTDILGLEVAGTVVAVGGSNEGECKEGNAFTPKQGDNVCALLPGGGFAEYAVASKGHCLPALVGQGLGVQSAGLPEALFTVWRNLFNVNGADSLRGKSVFIHGGSSSVGSTAIALARSFGASLVQTTAGSVARVKQCESVFGAHKAFNYRTDEWWQDAERADVVLDIGGGPLLDKNLKLLRQGGRLVVIGFMQGPKTDGPFSLNRLLVKNLTITGSVLRSAPEDEKTLLRNELLQHVWPRLLEQGDLKLPFISKMYQGKGLAGYLDAFHDLKNPGPDSLGGKLIVDITQP